MLNPSSKYGTKSAYTELRKFLIKDGYLLLQPEVFMRVENTKKNCIKHQNRIKAFLPKTGTVRMFILTEKSIFFRIVSRKKLTEIVLCIM